MVHDQDAAATIRLTVRHAKLNADLDYNALSYAWGERTPVKQILIRDKDRRYRVLTVRENLYDFFVAARKAYIYQGARSTENWTSAWLWIDQSHIDQTNQEERCH